MENLSNLSNISTAYSADLSKEESKLLDRQIRLWGFNCQKKIKSSKVIIFSYSAICQEILKNMLLVGVGSITLIINDKTIFEPGWFFNNEHDINNISTSKLGKNLVELLLDMNSSLFIEIKKNYAINTQVNLYSHMESVFLIMDVQYLVFLNRESMYGTQLLCSIICGIHRTITFSIAFIGLPSVKQVLKAFSVESISRLSLNKDLYEVICLLITYIFTMLKETQLLTINDRNTLADINYNKEILLVAKQLLNNKSFQQVFEYTNFDHLSEFLDKRLVHSFSYYHGSSIVGGLITNLIIKLIFNENNESEQSHNAIVYDGYNNNCTAFMVSLL